MVMKPQGKEKKENKKIIVIKDCNEPVTAFKVGDGISDAVELQKKGLIRCMSDGRYEVFSQEAVNGSGQICNTGDYIKIDSSGAPYPVKKEVFESKHEKRGSEWYQKPELLGAWHLGVSPIEECAEMKFLIDKGKIIINVHDEENYFTAEKWGTRLSADKRAVIVFRKVTRNSKAQIDDVEFSFVAKSEFDKNYNIVTSPIE